MSRHSVIERALASHGIASTRDAIERVQQMTLPTRPGAGLGGFAAYWKDDWTGLPDCHLDVRDLGGRRIPTNRLVVISTPALDGPALR